MNIMFPDKLFITFLWKDVSAKNNLKFLFHCYGKLQPGESHFSIEDSQLSVGGFPGVFQHFCGILVSINPKGFQRDPGPLHFRCQKEISVRRKEKGIDRGRAVLVGGCWQGLQGHCSCGTGDSISDHNTSPTCIVERNIEKKAVNLLKMFVHLVYSYFILILENSRCGPQKLLMMPSISFIDLSIKNYSTSEPVAIHLVAKSLLYISTSLLYMTLSS